MGAQGRVTSSSSSMQRVKVYRLNDDGKWDDQGTGHVSVDYLERSEDLGLVVIDEEDNDVLLTHRISADDIYRRQEDTIISWRDPDISTDLALSFQEATGCSYIWDHICGVQRNLHFSNLGSLEIGPRSTIEALEASCTSRANDDVFHGAHSGIGELPSIELSSLPLILKTVVVSGVSDHMRLVELILQEQDFFPKLVDLFKMCEDLESMDDLHMIFKLVKGIILLNSPRIFDKIFGDDLIMDIIGILEYDPDVPEVQRHRAYIKEHVVFKEAVPIKDPVVLSKIHQTYRISYIKDAILPRVLDDATISSLNSMIHANNALVVSLLKDDTSFIQELFQKMKSSNTSVESKGNLMLFLQEFCSLSKSLQLVQQPHLFRDLASEGVFDIITEALQIHDKKLISAGTDILILFLNQDPNLLRTYIIQQKDQSLLGLLVEGMITDFGEYMHCQFLEIIRILLDSYASSGSQKDGVVEIFYEKHLDQLIDVITASCLSKNISQTSADLSGRAELYSGTKPEILSNICELLCFCVIHHPYRIKCNFLLNNVIEKVLYLTRRKEKYLVVAAVRFMRTVISRNDEHLLRHIAKNNLLKPIVEAFIWNGNHYNMLNSGVLELLEYVRKFNINILIKYIVECFWDQLSIFENMGTIQALKLKYEQSLEKYDPKVNANTTPPRKQVCERGPEKEEEDYFNRDSDEEDSASVDSSNVQKRAPQQRLPNGTNISHSSIRTGSGALVDYEDDDDDDGYNPPPMNTGSCVDDEEITGSSTYKRKSIFISDSCKEVKELTKKQMLDGDRNASKNSVSSINIHSKTSLSSGLSHVVKEIVVSDAKRVEVDGHSSDCLGDGAGIMQSSQRNDSPLLPKKESSSDLVVNGTDTDS